MDRYLKRPAPCLTQNRFCQGWARRFVWLKASEKPGQHPPEHVVQPVAKPRHSGPHAAAQECHLAGHQHGAGYVFMAWQEFRTPKVETLGLPFETGPSLRQISIPLVQQPAECLCTA